MERLKRDMRERMVLSQTPLLACVNEENRYLPGQYETAHNIGRWWEAALLLEKTTGMKIPERMEKAMHLNLRAHTSNPYGLLLNPPEIHEKALLNYHNLREALLAYAALIEFRNSAYAKMQAERLLDTIDRRFFQNTLEDKEIVCACGIGITKDPTLERPVDDEYRNTDDTARTGRAIEGMFRYWQVSKSPKALEVMKKAVAFHRERAICADGSAPEWMKDSVHAGHNHSYLGTVRGLLLYALHFEDEELIKSVYETYRKTIRKYCCDESGFAPHDLARLRFPDQNGDPVGDHASCADTAYIAWLLSVKAGHSLLIRDFEKLMRGRLFFSQIMEGENIGAWGIYSGYFGTGSTIDVFASISSTLARIYRDMEGGIQAGLSCEEAEYETEARAWISGKAYRLLWRGNSLYKAEEIHA